MAVIFLEYSVFFDKGKIIVLLNGYQKKMQKTSSKEITMANKLMKEYYINTKK